MYSSPDLTRSTLDVLFVITLIILCGWVALPFLFATLWAAMIVISTWPLLVWLQAKLGGRRGLATAIMTIALLLVLVIPLTLAVGALVTNIDTLIAEVNSLKTFHLPPPPDWVARIPIQGPTLFAKWQEVAAEDPHTLAAQLAPYAGKVLRWFAAQVGGIGGMVLQFLLAVIISAILYVNGETVALGVRRFAKRVAGSSGEEATLLAAGTIRGVAMGVIVTALAQTIVASAGLVIASIPGAAFLGAAVLILCLAQLGPLLVMLPVVVWKFYSGDSLGGSILLVFTLVAGTMDNFLRPYLIKKGADLPLLMIFAGVIGGLIQFGVMGIFVGPVILAVTYMLLKQWVGPARRGDESRQSLLRSVTPFRQAQS
jgi:predicted PurR-regulated permease PerM